MRGGAAVFVIALAAASAGWTLAVRPIQAEAAAAVARAGDATSTGPATSPESRAALATALGPGTTAPVAPAFGLHATGQAGELAGVVAWERVPALLQWAAEAERPIVDLVVQPDPGDPGLARVRVRHAAGAHR